MPHRPAASPACLLPLVCLRVYVVVCAHADANYAYKNGKQVRTTLSACVVCKFRFFRAASQLTYSTPTQMSVTMNMIKAVMGTL